MKAIEEIAFQRGYYAAVVNLMMLHDMPHLAAELLREYGGSIDLKSVDGEDRKILRKLARDERLKVKR